jgi:glycosyltransferase involved in cell wall biosynthesis
VIFTGKIDPALIPFYYRLGEVSVDPKMDTEIADFALPIKLIESIAAEVPFITVDKNDVKVLMGEAGMTVKAGDVKALAEGILHILQNPEVAFAMREAASALQPEYTWDVHVKEVLTTFHSVKV